MRKFGEAFKEKQVKAEKIHENHIINDFKKIYNSLLEHYKLSAINDLSETSQISFLSELNLYWGEEKGLSNLGKSFLRKKSLRLTENSTPLQKKNFLKTKATSLLNELMRQSDLKYKLYGILDEMYMQTEAKTINTVLSPKMISDIVTESFADSLDGFVQTVYHEINESSKPKTNKKVFLKKNISESKK